MSSPPSAADEERMLQFDEAMVHFNAMFPRLGSSVIEATLCNCGGDGEADPSAEESKKERLQRDDHQKDRDGGMKGEKGKQRVRDPCVNDEKIALLIQNREFLRYLRRDPKFQHELLGRPHSSNRCVSRRTHCHRSSPRIRHLPGAPILLPSPHCSRSPNTRRSLRTSADVVVFRGKSAEPIPDGPPVEFRTPKQEMSIPEGPLIDYVDTEHRFADWTKRLRAKLTTAKNYPSAHYQLLDTPTTTNFLAVDKRSKGMLRGLAKKFGQMRTND